MSFPIESLLFLMLIAVAVMVARLSNLFSAAMLLGLFSLLSAGLFTFMDAVDVAFTEAAVGAGISTILILGTLALAPERERQGTFKLTPIVVVMVVGAALIYGTHDMPAYGDPNAPVHTHVAPGYIAGTAEHFGIPNIVTAVLGSYRGFDTFGETTVIFTAAIGVLLLLGPVITRLELAVRDTEHQPMRDNAIVRLVSRVCIPLILLFGLYVQFHGDFGPGGGFQAGVIFAAGLILHGLLFGLDDAERVASPFWVTRGLAFGVVLYGGVGVATMLLGGNFLDYRLFDPGHPAHGLHLGLLLIELGVGITVACAMLMLYYAFAGRGLR